MSEIRAIIRELLAEEIAALRDELMGGSKVEQVRVATSAELTEFARTVLSRAASDPGFASDLRDGKLRFAPAGGNAVSSAPAAPPIQPASQVRAPVVSAPTPKAELRKNLITVRDIEAVVEGEPRLRILKNARLTPLAADEARRRSIRIERTLT